MVRKEYLMLFIIFCVTFAARLYIAFLGPTFEYDAYFSIRQAEHIRQGHLPQYNDPYSYGGRIFTFLPLFHYILAFFSYIIDLELVAKIIPNFIASMLGIVVYFVCKNITKDSNAALFSAFISGFVPIFFAQTINNVSVLTAVVPVMLLLMHFFINIRQDRKFTVLYIIFFIALLLLHASSLIFVLALYFYLLICKLEHIKLHRSEIEITIFSTFLWLWVNMMIYKKALTTHGIYVIWQNLPTALFHESFAQTDILDALVRIGVLPFLFGLYIIYRGFFGAKNKTIYLFVAFAFSTAITLWLKLISLVVGFTFLGVILAVLFSQFYVRFMAYFAKTKVSHYKPYVLIGLIAVFVITSIIPSIYEAVIEDDVPSNQELEALVWLKANTPHGSVVLASPNEGHLLAYKAARKNVADTNFILVTNLDQRLQDIEEMYKTRFITRAVGLLNKYSVDYIYVSRKTERDLQFEELLYYDQNCIRKEYESGSVKIFKSTCYINE